MILTGQPPYIPGPSSELMFKVMRGDLSEATERLEKCGADGDLIALCRECLSPERENRPRDAGIVAEKISAYLASVQERLRRAELDRETAHVQAREERRRRHLSISLATVLVALLLGLGGAAWWYQQYQSKLEVRAEDLEKRVLVPLYDANTEARELVNRLYDSAYIAQLLSNLQTWDKSLNKIRSSWSEAQAIADSDPELIGGLTHEYLFSQQTQLKEFEADRAFVAQWEVLRQKFMETGGGRGRKKPSESYEELFKSRGWDVKHEKDYWVRSSLEQSAIHLLVAVVLDCWAAQVLIERPAP